MIASSQCARGACAAPRRATTTATRDARRVSARATRRERHLHRALDAVVGARARRDAVMRASGDEDETISNLDKLLGDFGAVPEREELMLLGQGIEAESGCAAAEAMLTLCQWKRGDPIEFVELVNR